MKVCSELSLKLACIGIGAVWMLVPAISAFALQDSGIVLNALKRTNGLFQLSLSCESEVEYLIESSPDLANWTPVVTNSDLGILRTISVTAPEEMSFYRASRKPLPLFGAALAAVGGISLIGNNVLLDSFDSSDPNYSINGMYTVVKRKGNGDVITFGSVTNIINAGNAEIMGRVNTGPGGTVAIGPNGSIGSVAWVTNLNTGVEASYENPGTMNTHFPQVDSPDQVYAVDPGAWVASAPPAGTIGGVFYDHVYDTPGDNYYRQAAPLNDRMYVGTNVNLVLWLREGADMSGGDVIDIAPGGRLTIYTAEAFLMSGSAAVNNYSPRAPNFSLRGLPTCPTIELWGNNNITGCICAPDSDLSLGGGGIITYDFVGSIVARTVQLTGHVNFHFDEALKMTGPVR